MHPDMFQPLLVMIVALYCFYALALILFTRAEILRRERDATWVRDLALQAESSRENE
jgi:heme exporter protein C